MSATPVYDAVLQDLAIDPARIAARPRWTLERAERALAHRNNLLGSGPADGSGAGSAQGQPGRPAANRETHGSTAAVPAT
jgi:hypothetical protein